eukprot:scaffold13380_cov110-Cylindrotheca_fusiformis.AAC.1
MIQIAYSSPLAMAAAGTFSGFLQRCSVGNLRSTSVTSHARCPTIGGFFLFPLPLQNDVDSDNRESDLTIALVLLLQN